VGVGGWGRGRGERRGCRALCSADCGADRTGTSADRGAERPGQEVGGDRPRGLIGTGRRWGEGWAGSVGRGLGAGAGAAQRTVRDGCVVHGAGVYTIVFPAALVGYAQAGGYRTRREVCALR
jgi:hypothetical protein